ncbi:MULTISPECIES: long-chain fatty acid--CoA ligase [unclassified Iodidimonas]|jgi:long-chain acyl-CoA synthetase|uniref:long-chain-fatty-acid--CoA ligase n=1 Tax=unclassified Iodidimonas TaxID=2626145 RepID=UPI0024822119|nr:MULTISPECIES: long-chain fatty acid--CoA ligase [unclassified Iodidimonas]
MSTPRQPWHQFYEPDAFHPDDLLADNLASMLADIFATHAANPAYSCILPNGARATLSYADIDRHSAAIAFYLRDHLGLAPGDVVAIQSPNILSYPVVAYGILRAGLILTGINPLYTAAEAGFQLRDSGAKALFVIDLFGDRLQKSLEGSAVRHVIRLSVVDFFPAPKRLLIDFVLRRIQKRIPPMDHPSIPLARALKLGRAAQSKAAKAGRGLADLRAERAIDDSAIYQYTGGTTGRSKGAEITERNILSNITQQDRFTGDHLRAARRGDETSLLVLPLYHVYALAIGSMHAMRMGTHVVLAPNPRPLSNLRTAFEQFDITMLPGVNTLFNELLKQPWFTENPPRNLRWCFSGAAPLTQSTRKRWEDLTGSRIYEGYGLTEGTCIVTSSPLDDRARPGTVGIPIPGTEIKIIDDDGKEQPTGQPGEVLVRGPQVMRGYLGRADATADTVRDGWLHTGDIGVMDADGFLSIIDRKKDMLIISGFNVYPFELEEVLIRHPDVLEAAVVGIEDAHAGEAAVAYIVLRESPDQAGDGVSEDSLRRHCAEALTNYKRPKYFITVPELPKSPVGKVLRRELRDQARAEFARTPNE